MIEVPFLRRFSIFSGLDESVLERVAATMHERRCQKGEFVFQQGQPGEAIYFLREGRIKILRLEPDGRGQIIRFFDPGEPFALVVALDRHPYPATAQAVRPSRVWHMRVDDYHRLQEDLPSLNARATNIAASRLRETQNRAHTLAVRDVHGRLAEFLLGEAQKRGQPKGENLWAVPNDVTREDLAALMGAARETVSRALSDLRRSGAVNDTGMTWLLDQERLNEWLVR